MAPLCSFLSPSRMGGKALFPLPCKPHSGRRWWQEVRSGSSGSLCMMVNGYPHVFLHPAFVSLPRCSSRSCSGLYLRDHLGLRWTQVGSRREGPLGWADVEGFPQKMMFPSQVGAGSWGSLCCPWGWCGALKLDRQDTSAEPEQNETSGSLWPDCSPPAVWREKKRV